MPYPNEHAARLNDPGKYDKIRRENGKFGAGIDAIWGVTEEGKAELQAIRFSKSKFTPEQAKAWLKEHDKSPILFEAASEKDSADHVRRFDIARLDRVQKTKEGWIKTDAVVTRTGIFTYRNDDGSPRLELRHPKEVFNSLSLNSMKMIPLTNDHPRTDTGLLDTTNAKQFGVGFTGENVTVEGEHVRIPITITDGDAITAVESGRRGLSLGYECDLVENGGEYDGMRFDARQTAIRYNHLAIVDTPRAGDAARIKLDGTCIEDAQPLPLPVTQKEEAKMPKVNLDGIDYEAAQEVINALAKLQTRVDKAEGDLKTTTASVTTITGERDTFKAKVDSLEATLAKVPDQITAAVANRLSLERKATIVLDGEDVSKLADKEIKTKIILAVFPNAKDQLATASDAYLDARLDAACEMADVAGREAALASQRNASAPRHDGGGATNEPDVSAAAERFAERTKEGWKGKKKKDSKGEDDDGNPQWGQKNRKGC